MQRRILDLQDAARGKCGKCGLKKIEGCNNGTVEVAAGHGGRHMVCLNRKEEDTFFEALPRDRHIVSPGPVNPGFLELMAGEKKANEVTNGAARDEPKETAPGTAPPEAHKDK